jgi:hypothetical protein
MSKQVKVGLWIVGGVLVALFWGNVAHGFIGGVLVTLTVIVAVIGGLLTWVEDEAG